MLEFLNSLSWPAAFAIVASVVSIITGLFGYVISSRKKADVTPTVESHPDDYEKIHSRINDAVERIAVMEGDLVCKKIRGRIDDAVERIAAIEGDLKEIRAFTRICSKQLSDHEQRDIDDFKLVDAKIDRLMDIVVRMLQDDKL